MDIEKCRSDTSAEASEKELDQLRREVEKWKSLYEKELNKCRFLMNHMHELKGNIRVFVRVKPITSNEEVGTIKVVDENTIAVLASTGIKNFNFDHVFGPDSTQIQTGSGKTYTMEGVPEDPGVNINILKRVFDLIEDRKTELAYDATVSIFEIYNEQIVDLSGVKCSDVQKASADSSDSSSAILSSKKLKVKPRMGEFGIRDSQIAQIPVDSFEGVWKVVETGKKHRTTENTHMNLQSSRSHCVVYFQLSGRRLDDNTTISSKLFLVDLAGSERINQSKVQGKVMDEAISINKSLSALSRVFEALQSKKAHIPFRDSMLTYLLKDVLSGSTKTCVIINLCPSLSNLPQSINSIEFGVKINKIELGHIKKNVSNKKNDLFNWTEVNNLVTKNKDQQIRIQQLEAQLEQDLNVIKNLKKKQKNEMDKIERSFTKKCEDLLKSVQGNSADSVGSWHARLGTINGPQSCTRSQTAKIPKSPLPYLKTVGRQSASIKLYKQNSLMSNKENFQYYSGDGIEPSRNYEVDLGIVAPEPTLGDVLVESVEDGHYSHNLDNVAKSCINDSLVPGGRPKKSVSFSLSDSVLRYNQRNPIESFRKLIKSRLNLSGTAFEKQKTFVQPNGARRVFLKREDSLSTIRSTFMRTPVPNKMPISRVTPLKG